MKSIRNIIFALVIMVVPFSLTVVSRNILYEKVDLVKPVANDLLRVRQIPIDTAATLNSAVLFALKRDVIIREKPVSVTVLEDIENLVKSVESESGSFLPVTEEFVYGDVCKILNQTLNNTACPRYLNGALQKGYSGFLYQAQLEFSEYVEEMQDRDGSDYSFATFRDYFPSVISSFFGLTYTTLIDSMEIFTERIIDKLVVELHEGTDEIVKYVISNLIVSLFFAISSLFVFYFPMKRQRRYLGQTLLLFPFEMMDKNQHIKRFLMRDKKEFYQIFKTYAKRVFKNPFLLPVNFLAIKRRSYSTAATAKV